MELLVGTLTLRPYVFGFLAAFLLAGMLDLGLRRTLLFAGWLGPLAWLCEFTSTRIGIPFGMYHYTGTTRGQELFVADVPIMDCLSFTFLAYAAFCLARAALSGRRVPGPALALVSGVLMMALDVVMDPVAVRGERWFLGRIFYYPDGGVYFGVPLSNFAGWIVVGTLGVGGFLWLSGWREHDTPGRPAGLASVPGSCWPGIALYYAVFAFNLAVTGWIGEWRLLVVGAGLHAVLAATLWTLSQRPGARLGLEKQQA
ncbi:MAG TPA: carotenoid biosynthesis protein [Methylomirabilota bacterium]|nr:carotenoid biosynthesis protein [Methylomirabilota bacterium]